MWLGGDNGENNSGPGALIQGLIRARDGMKILIGDVTMAFWTGPLQPNGTKTPDATTHCGTADAPLCLYNILEDPTEHVNLASVFPDVLKELGGRLAVLQGGVFDPDRGTPDPRACNVSMGRWGSFVGPFLDLPPNRR